MNSSLSPQVKDVTQQIPGDTRTLAAALSRLDALLRAAVSLVKAAGEPVVAADFYRGLEIRPEDAERALAAEPSQPFFKQIHTAPGRRPLAYDVPVFEWLARTFSLAGFDLDVTLLALAPEIDLRYERLYAYLQDDVTRKHPTVDLALNLFASDAGEKLALRSRFAPDAPLQKHALVRIFCEPGMAEPPLLARYIKLDEQITRLVLGQNHLDPRLAGFGCRKLPAPPPALSDFCPLIEERLAALATRSVNDGCSVRLYFEGSGRFEKLRAADAVARAIDAQVLALNLQSATETGRDLSTLLRVAFREAWLGKAVLFLDDADTVRPEVRPACWQVLLELLQIQPGVVILSGTQPWRPCGRPLGVLPVHFGPLDRVAARRAWEAHLKDSDLVIGAPEIDVLADRFRLASDQIADAVACAQSGAKFAARSAANQAEIGFEELCAAARAQNGHALEHLARKVKPGYTWDDLVLPDEQLEQIREVCEQAKHRYRVFDEWGFDRKLSLGKGLNVLFSGPPGTGKTMAAEVIASELKLDLYKIDLSQVVSKYIGETEKNLDRIFSAAQNSNAILFFDEADALFGKRSEVKDSHDRYANIEIGYLLQKMEEYEGIAILSTNVKHHIDEAFLRRMQALVEFPFPEETERRRVWQLAFPNKAPVGPDVDFAALARAVRLAGGNIKNIARLAAFLAAADGGVISMPHLIKASRREYQKLGRMWNENEWRLDRTGTPLE